MHFVSRLLSIYVCYAIMTLCDATQLCSDAFHDFFFSFFWHEQVSVPAQIIQDGRFRFPYSQAQISYSLEEVDVGKFLHLVHIFLCFDHFLVVE